MKSLTSASIIDARRRKLFLRPWLIVEPLTACPGYAEGLDLVLRDQNAVAKAGVDRRQRQVTRRRSPTSSTKEETFIPRLLAEQKSVNALCFFVSTWVDTTPDPHSQRGFLELLPVVYSDAKQDSALALCMSAISLMQFNKFQLWMREPLTIEVKRILGDALAATSQALHSSVASLTDETLLAVCFLGYFEEAQESYAARISSPRHFEGAAALINKRQGAHMTDFARRMLLGVRHCLVQRAIHTASPIDVSTPIWQVHDGVPHNAATLLDLLHVDLANLMSTAYKSTNSIPVIFTEDNLDLEDPLILERAKSLDADLSQWQTVVPSYWLPIPIPKSEVPKSVVLAGIWQDHADIYPSITISSIWNEWRTARIKVLSLIARNTSGHERLEAIQIIQELADGICGSVPFTLGDRDTPMNLYSKTADYPTLPGKEVTDKHRGKAAALGGWHLFMPMKTVLGAQLYLNPGQSDWMRLQLQRLATMHAVVRTP